MTLNIKVGYIGFGRMGSALAQGAVAAGVITPAQISAFDPDIKAQKKISKLGFREEKNLKSLISASDLIFLCVKPQMMENTLSSINRVLANDMLKKKCFVSIAAGIPLKKLEKGLGSGVPVIRVMPNTPALLGAGMAAYSLGRHVKSEHEDWTGTIIGSVGEKVKIPEKWMDAVTAVSGSGPAYVFYLAESMLKAAESLGLTEELGKKIVNQTIFGAGKMLAQSGKSPVHLREQVTSPGGTTAAGIYQFDKAGLKKIIIHGIKAAALRSEELSK